MDKNIAIEFQNVGKQYRLGRVGTGTLQHDINRWWQTTILRKDDPYLQVGEVNDRSTKGNSEYVWALKDISFKVEQGDVVGIIGKNGAGKSTLLKLLSHITAPTTGDIYYRGRIASLLEVGTGFHPEMTGRENIYMNGSILGMNRQEINSKIDEIIDFAGVERYVDTPVKRYSSGMRVRLGFAVAAFLEPEILVVDEVLTVGDAEFQKKAIGKMDAVAREGGRTVLFVSHNMAAIRSLCHHGVVLSNGLVSLIGTSEECVDYYLKENQTINNGPMKDNVNYKKNFIEVHRITIDDSESSNIVIGSNQETMTLEIEGYTTEAFTGNIKLYFRTTSGVALAALAESTYKGELLKFKEGAFSIKKKIMLPKYLNHGSIVLDLLLYNKSINYFRAEQLASVEIVGNCDSMGQPLNIGFEGLFGFETI